MKELQTDDAVSVHAVYFAQQQKQGRPKQRKAENEVTYQPQNKPLGKKNTIVVDVEGSMVRENTLRLARNVRIEDL
ncbi:hypothetical protein HOLleu_42209 [Holothuria leucospilota]|uniref:Uncharacterized protein n=1 Tax=Holothuria leucospilota TaxID=206669 RepID=A0A9Q0YCV8_HOLLE|nr:hypothetical protein HOLleu_42209 [Holothuria leucospilota]